ncbi:sulfotransferase [Hyphomicrobium sp. B1]|uniref:sulfotransferase n=1 Tax=Hyphomicrobium sp. B1 TaxID=3075651 RepID=UPI003C2C1CE0
MFFIESTIRHDLDNEIQLFQVETPFVGQQSAGHLLEVSGWIVSSTSDPVVEIIVGCGTAPIAAFPINVARPDVDAAFPGLGAEKVCGFRGLILAARLPRHFKLSVGYRTMSGAIGKIYECSGKYEGLCRPARASAFNPVMVTSLGRTGSSWLMHLLLQHPLCMTLDDWPYEAAVVQAAVARLRSDAEHPHGREQPQSWTPLESGSRWGSINPFAHEHILRWFESDQIQIWAEAASLDIIAFYRRHSIELGKPGASLFLEKFKPDDNAAVARQLFPEAREILLVRDFRDMVASIIAFNERRHALDFGATAATNNSDYVSLLRPSVEALLEVRTCRPDVLVLRYEDLIVNERNELAKVLFHIGADPSEEAVAEVLHNAYLSSSSSTHFGHRTSADAVRSIGRWRYDLSTEVAEACQREFKDVLGAFGYS